VGNRSLEEIKAIVVHQTDSYDENSVFQTYNGIRKIGPHFLITKEGLIYQTASLKKRCNHVGAHLKSKCLYLEKDEGIECKDDKLLSTKTKYGLLGRDLNSMRAKLSKDTSSDLSKDWHNLIFGYRGAINAVEKNKDYPDRFPMNAESAGIELVGKRLKEREDYVGGIWETPSSAQNESLTWLVGELMSILNIQGQDISRHPDSRFKDLGEAKETDWNQPNRRKQ
jgi:hypothetical protein